MWDRGNHFVPKESLEHTNDILSKLEGELDTKTAQITFAKFCRNNLNFTSKLLTGFDLYPFQEIMIRAMMHKDYSLAVCGRGMGKSFIGAMLAIMYSIFCPGVKIGLCSASFRQARMIFQTIEDISLKKGGAYLKQCLVGEPKHKSDEWIMKIGESTIIALPLGAGDKIRGYRFNLMIIDELLLMSERVVNEVILPFMTTQMDQRDRETMRQAQDKLILAGEMTEAERIRFPNNKLVGLTSASYEFEYLFQLYKSYENLIFDREMGTSEKREVSHCIFHFSYEMAPEGMYDKKNLDQAKAVSTPAQFSREYGGQFTGESSGYFMAQLLHQCTLKEGEEPHALVSGREEFEYLLAVDPNFDDSETSDDFGMAVFEMHPDGTDILVHPYAVAKGDIKKRGEYIKYLFKNFNIVYVIADSRGGTRFFNDLAELDILDKKVVPFDHDFDNKNQAEGARKSKASYNLVTGQIIHLQVFSSNWIREANELLQNAIHKRKMLFASKVYSESQILSCRAKDKNIKAKSLWYANNKESERSMDDFVDNLGWLIELTKKETSLIEVRTSVTGNQSFDLPANLLRDKSTRRVRKDSYTVLFLGKWGCECYRKIKNLPEETNVFSFMPFFADNRR